MFHPLLFFLLSANSFAFNITLSYQKLCIPLNAQVNWVHWFNQGFTIEFESHLSPGNKSKRYSECLYCKWLLKNWHSHLENTSHLSQTNEGLALQSEIDISLWTSTRIFWILREVHSSPETAETLLSSLAPPKEEKKDCPVDLPCSSIFTHSSWAMAVEIWPVVLLNGWPRDPLCRHKDVSNWILGLKQNNTRFLWTLDSSIFYAVTEKLFNLLCKSIRVPSHLIGQE